MTVLPFPTEAVAPKRQVNADGSVEFRCEGCGADVFCAVDDGFEFPACLECRWFGERPQIKRPAPRIADGSCALCHGTRVYHTGVGGQRDCYLCAIRPARPAR